MITVEEATQLVFTHLFDPRVESVSLDQSIDRTLAEPIVADRDLPPFNRITMDGIAINTTGYVVNRTYKIESVQAAGQPAKTLQDPTHCIEVMTGALLPLGTDAVIPYEQLKIEHGIATAFADTITPFQHVHRQGADARANQNLLNSGLTISPAEVALMASVGKSKIKVYQPPAVAVISTGNELIDVTDQPAPHQIRRSNSFAIHAALQQVNVSASIFHIQDEYDVVFNTLRDLLRDFDVLILSGGVSKGKFDFVPQALEALGVKKIIHQVSQRPGKPFWFGRSEKKMVFALPGNPVSTYLCFYRYVMPWLRKSLHQNIPASRAKLAANFSFKPDLTFFLPVQVANENGQLMAYPKSGTGSGDFTNLKNVDGFLELPRTADTFAQGEVFDYYSFRN